MLVPEKLLLSPSNVDDATPEMAPQVTLPFTTLRAEDVVQFPVAMKRFVVDAVVVKRVVVVAFVVVPLSTVSPPVTVDDAAMITPIVVVGVSAPFTTAHVPY